MPRNSCTVVSGRFYAFHRIVEMLHSTQNPDALFHKAKSYVWHLRPLPVHRGSRLVMQAYDMSHFCIAN